VLSAVNSVVGAIPAQGAAVLNDLLPLIAFGAGLALAMRLVYFIRSLF